MILTGGTSAIRDQSGDTADHHQLELHHGSSVLSRGTSRAHRVLVGPPERVAAGRGLEKCLFQVGMPPGRPCPGAHTEELLNRVRRGHADWVRGRFRNGTRK